MAVVPVVGILFNKEAFTPTPNVNEVESIFDVPLEMFLKVSALLVVISCIPKVSYLLFWGVFFFFQHQIESYL